MLKAGDIGFVMHMGSFVSESISWFVKSKWSHTYLIKEVTPKNIYTIETGNFNVMIGEHTYYQKDPSITYEVWSPIGLSDEERQAIVVEGEKYIGRIYGYFQFISLALRALLKRTGIQIKNFITQGIMCDDLVGYSYKVSSLAMFKDYDPKQNEIEEFYEFIKNSGKFELVEKKDLG
jgi:hypothetical protein